MRGVTADGAAELAATIPGFRHHRGRPRVDAARGLPRDAPRRRPARHPQDPPRAVSQEARRRRDPSRVPDRRQAAARRRHPRALARHLRRRQRRHRDGAVRALARRTPHRAERYRALARSLLRRRGPAGADPRKAPRAQRRPQGRRPEKRAHRAEHRRAAPHRLRHRIGALARTTRGDALRASRGLAPVHLARADRAHEPRRRLPVRLLLARLHVLRAAHGTLAVHGDRPRSNGCTSTSASPRRLLARSGPRSPSSCPGSSPS